MALEQQMDQLRIAHQQQVSALRDEIAEKQQLINDIKEYVGIFVLKINFNVFFTALFQFEPEINIGPTTIRSRL